MSKSSASWTNVFFKCSRDSVTIQDVYLNTGTSRSINDLKLVNTINERNLKNKTILI